MGGCGSCTRAKPRRVVIPSTKLIRLQSAHPLVTEDCTALQKARALEAIKKDDLILFMKELGTTKPMENLRIRGENYTCLHAAAEFNSFRVMEILLKWIKDNRPAIFKALNNIPDPNGNSPPMLCAINNSVDALYVMYCYQAIDHNLKNSQGDNLEELCKKYSPGCLKILETGKLNPENADSVQEVPELSVQDKQLNVYLKKFVISQLAKYEESLLLNSQHELDIALRGIRGNTKIYKLLIKFVKEGGTFEDKEFKREINSICPNSSHKDYPLFENAVWKRPHEFFNCDYDKISLLDSIDLYQIVPGVIPQGYILATLATIAEYPTRLSKIFVSKKANKFGVYSLRYYDRGIPTEIIIDDFIPCDPQTSQPLFSRPKNTGLWLLLAEKAWAKRYGAYIEIQEGKIEDALEDLLGCPTYEYFLSKQSDQEIWNTLSNAYRNNFIICASTKNSESPFHVGPAYSIISVHYFENHFIVKLRNIWKKMDWNGEYANYSYQWTLELKAIVGFTQVEDGVICLGFNEFKKYFESYTIAYYEDNWRYNYLDIESQPKHAEYIKFKLESACEMYLSLHQKDSKYLAPEQRQEHRYSPAELILARVEEDGTYSPVIRDTRELDENGYSGCRTLYASKLKKLRLEKGEYIIRCKVRWLDGQKNNFTLSAYAEKEIELIRVKPVKDFLPKLFENLAKNSVKFQEDRSEKPHCCDFYGNFLFFCLENKTTSNLDVYIELNEMNNLKIDKRHKNTENSWKFQCAPSKCIVTIAKKINTGEDASFKYWELKCENC